MYLRRCYRKKENKRHGYWALVESYRTARGPRQRVVAYLGEMDEAGRIGVQQAAQPQIEQPNLFEKVEAEWVEVDLKRVRVECARQFGGVWLGYELLQRLELIEFLTVRMAVGREDIPWAVMSLVLLLGRWCDPSSELHLAEQGYEGMALADLLGVPAEEVNHYRLYRTLDRILPHKEALEKHLKQLSRLKNARVATLTSKNGLPCDTVNWTIEDNNHSFWLYMACGLVRIPRTELDAWAVAVDHNENTKPNIQATVFDSSDGVKSLPDSGHLSPQVAKTKDGRMWFLPEDGVSIVDPLHLHLNKFPPPVHIEQIIADHKTYDAASDGNRQVRLPPRVRDLQIDYTALSLVAPEKMLFRYKLEGWDRDWQDAGTRRQAFYSNLPPRRYTFRVTACNNSGVWNEAGTSLNFFVAPAYHQTWWFRSASVIAFLGLLVALYQLRLRQLSRQFNVRLEARVSERTRIARDLHDTLLQSFQGVLLKFHVVRYMISDRPAEAQKTLDAVIEQARQAITEGRDAVQGLRSPGLVGNDIAQALSMLGENLATDQNGLPRPDFHVQVEGTPRDLSPFLRDDVYRIACEALRNSFRHAHAGRIEVEIHYDQRQLRLRVRDNGKGIDTKVLSAGARAGHYGLPGMHERAKDVGGKLFVWSELDSGTEAELTIPASIA